MHWTVIDTNDDLQKLNELVDWEDSEGIEYYASEMNEDYFPVDVSRSGRLKKNIHLLCRTCSSQGPYLELVFIDCDLYDGKFLEEPFLHGRVDILKRVEIENNQKSLVIRCSRLIYRFLESNQVVEGSYYKTCWNIE